MTQPEGRIQVDPDGVTAVGEAYIEHVALYEGFITELTSIRTRYADSWGDDEMGTKFSEKFLRGMDNLESLLRGVKGSLQYTSDGLRASGKLYAEVDDGARDAGYQMASNFETNLPRTTRRG